MAGYVDVKRMRPVVRRGAITAFVARHQLVWDAGMAALAVVYLAVGVLTDESRGPSPAVLGVLSIVFLTEFVARCWDADSRRQYLRTHWMDLVSCLPMIGGLRAIRLLRLLRLCALGRAATVSHHAAARHADQTAWLLGPVLCMIWLGSATAYWILEHGVNHHLHAFGDALYWAFITTATVGYGDVQPVTAYGHLLSGALIFVGIGLVGYLSGQVTARFLHQADKDTAILDEVTQLRRELREVHALLAARAEA